YLHEIYDYLSAVCLVKEGQTNCLIAFSKVGEIFKGHAKLKILMRHLNYAESINDSKLIDKIVRFANILCNGGGNKIDMRFYYQKKLQMNGFNDYVNKLQNSFGDSIEMKKYIRNLINLDSIFIALENTENLKNENRFLRDNEARLEQNVIDLQKKMDHDRVKFQRMQENMPTMVENVDQNRIADHNTTTYSITSAQSVSPKNKGKKKVIIKKKVQIPENLSSLTSAIPKNPTLLINWAKIEINDLNNLCIFLQLNISNVLKIFDSNYLEFYFSRILKPKIIENPIEVSKKIQVLSEKRHKIVVVNMRQFDGQFEKIHEMITNLKYDDFTPLEWIKELSDLNFESILGAMMQCLPIEGELQRIKGAFGSSGCNRDELDPSNLLLMDVGELERPHQTINVIIK
ncbi:MAG: hypothetical protein MHPSP_001120, partial [Paramarteilia canceri]